MNASTKTGLIYSTEYLNHVTPEGHPESPRRAEVVVKALDEADLTRRMVRLQPSLATEQEILRCHRANYFQTAKSDVEHGFSDLSTGDTNICERSFDVA